MSDAKTPAQSVPVYSGELLCVSDGANMGDPVNFAEDMILDDIYRLIQSPVSQRLSLCSNGVHFTVSQGTQTGTPGATVCVDSVLTFMSPDGETTDVLILVELDATGHVEHSHVLPLAPLVAKTDYALVTIDTAGARAKLAQVACVSFTRGTHITMASGAQVPIEDLRPGDRILTRDEGAQEIRWIGQSTARASGEFAPIRIKAGTLNNDHDLIVSPDHRLFIYQRQDRLGAGRSELLIKARHLVNEDTVRVMQGGFVDYFQLLFDDHHIIYAEGIAAESFFVDPRTSPALPDDLMGASHGSGLADLDVQEGLLNRPNVAEILRRASQR
ncbi:MAG: Hint domain-containing protein [Aliishimia sp.]